MYDSHPASLHCSSLTEIHLWVFSVQFSNLTYLQNLPTLHFGGLFGVKPFTSCQNLMVSHNYFIPQILLPCHWRKCDWFDRFSVWCICQLLLITFTSFAYRWVEYCSLSTGPRIPLSTVLPCLQIRYYICPFPVFQVSNHALIFLFIWIFAAHPERTGKKIMFAKVISNLIFAYVALIFLCVGQLDSQE